MQAILQHSFTRFLLVGVLNTLVGLSSIYLLLHVVGLPYWPATFFGNVIGALVSYFLNKRFTFRVEGAVSKSLWKFFLVTMVCYCFSYWLGLEVSSALPNLLPGWPRAWTGNAAVLIGSGVYTIMNYAGHRAYTFR